MANPPDQRPVPVAATGLSNLPLDVRSLDQGEMRAWMEAAGEPAYRADQVLRWLYVSRAAAWDEMTNLPRALRARLATAFTLIEPVFVRRQGARDTTRKYLWQLADGSFIESVLIPSSPALYGEPADRRTLCVSTQVGCAYGCKFCASGLEGWKRNLGVAEIVGQIVATERHEAAREASATAADSPDAARAAGVGLEAQPAQRWVDNLVIMGMGEPLANYEALLKALRILNAPWGGGIGARRITISTSGLAPQIRRLAQEPEAFRLAISLHGATDEVRAKIMPVNRKYPLRELIDACEYYRQQKGGMMTFEYILIDGVNAELGQARDLARLAARVRAKVNLIPCNPVEGLSWRRPPEARQEAFRAELERAGVVATLRREKGTDIDAACGQLRLRTERELELGRLSGAPPVGPNPD